MDRSSPENESGRLELNPPDRHREKQINAENLTNAGTPVKQINQPSGAMMARLILFSGSQCGEGVRREASGENDSTELWYSCGPTWACEGIRDAQAEFDVRLRRLMTSDYVKRHRDKFSVRKGNS
jgi:hypothetical protein